MKGNSIGINFTKATFSFAAAFLTPQFLLGTEQQLRALLRAQPGDPHTAAGGR